MLAYRFGYDDEQTFPPKDHLPFCSSNPPVNAVSVFYHWKDPSEWSYGDWSK